ncbi:MAG: hypothetical protein M1480_10580 [Bacteroidetes bacterium]|nr:hypothetical protein [Bacteroidota bacterium]
MKFSLLSSIILISSSLIIGQSNWKQLGRPFGGSIYSITEISGTLFIGTSNSGIWCWSEKDTLWQRVDGGKINTDVYCLIADSVNNIYAGSLGNVYKLSRRYSSEFDTTAVDSKFKLEKFWTVQARKPKDRINYSIVISKDNSLLYGTDDGIFMRVFDDSLLKPINNGLKNVSINYLFINSKEEFFAGTVSGIFKSTNHGENWEDISNGLDNSNIRVITESKGTLYIATHGGGVYAFNKRKNQWSNISNKGGRKDGIPNPYISGLVCDNNGNIYASTYDYGVYYSSNGGLSWIKINGDYSNQKIYSIYLSKEGNLYAGTLGSGVYEIITSKLNENHSMNSKKDSYNQKEKRKKSKQQF